MLSLDTLVPLERNVVLAVNDENVKNSYAIVANLRSPNSAKVNTIAALVNSFNPFREQGVAVQIISVAQPNSRKC